jgi:hypothetical protein
MSYRKIFHAKLICIYFFTRYFRSVKFRKPRSCFLSGVATIVELGCAYFSARKMFAIIEVIVLRALVIIQSYQCAFHRIAKVLLVDKRVCTQNNLKYYLLLLSLPGFLWEGRCPVWIYRRWQSVCLLLVWARSHKWEGCLLLLCKTFLNTIQDRQAHQPYWKAFKCLFTCHFE